MNIEDYYIGLSGGFIILYFLGMGILRTASLDLHVYDTYYILDVSSISLLLLVISIADVVAYKILRFSFGQLPQFLSIAQLVCTILFFAVTLFLTLSRTFVRTNEFIVIVSMFLISQLLLIAIYFGSRKAS